MDPTCVVVRNAFHTITKTRECLYANLVKVSYRLVSVASDETLTTCNKEIHTTLNCMPDQDSQDGRCPKPIFRLIHPDVTSITFCSTFTDVFSGFVGVFLFVFP